MVIVGSFVPVDKSPGTQWSGQGRIAGFDVHSDGVCELLVRHELISSNNRGDCRLILGGLRLVGNTAVAGQRSWIHTSQVGGLHVGKGCPDYL